MGVVFVPKLGLKSAEKWKKTIFFRDISAFLKKQTVKEKIISHILENISIIQLKKIPYQECLGKIRVDKRRKM